MILLLGFPAHQDAPAYVSFGLNYHVTCLLAADEATEENGCLEVVPRHPSQGMLPHPGEMGICGFSCEKKCLSSLYGGGGWGGVHSKRPLSVYYSFNPLSTVNI